VSRDVRLLQRHWSRAICPVISKCSVEIRKNSRTALSSNEGRPSPSTGVQLELGCQDCDR
jgi:hypothetical protein